MKAFGQEPLYETVYQLSKLQFTFMANFASFAVLLLVCLLVLICCASIQPKTLPSQVSIVPDAQSIIMSTSLKEETSLSEYTGLHCSLFGEDYMLVQNNTNPDIWNQTWLDRFAELGNKVSRLWSRPSTFAACTVGSIYDPVKMDAVIAKFQAYGMKVVIAHLNFGDSIDFYGSTEWWDWWISIFNRYKNNPGVLGFQIANEPESYTWSPASAIGNIDSQAKLNQIFKMLIDQGLAIAPTKKQFYPNIWWCGDGADKVWNWATYIAKIEGCGIQNYSNVIFDVAHPYMFAAQEAAYTPEEYVDEVWATSMSQAINYFGASRCWIGETYADGEGLTPSIQIEFLTRLINKCVQHGIGFQIVQFPRFYNWCLPAIQASNWLDQSEPPTPPIPPPPAEYYYVNVSASTGGQASPAGITQVLVGQGLWVHASANTDYTFSNWKRNDVQVSTNPNYQFTGGVANITYNMVAYFTYTPPDTQYFTVNISAGTGGSCTPTGTQQSPVGTPLAVTASASDGYTFDSWTRNSVAGWSVTNPASITGYAGQTITLAAVFEANPPPPPPEPAEPTTYTVYIQTAAGGTTSLTGEQTLLAGDEGEYLTVTVTSVNANTRFVYWLLDGVNVGSGTFRYKGVAGTYYTLIPVFQRVEQPPPNQWVQSSSAAVGIVSGTPLFAKVKRGVKKQKPIELSEILKRLKRISL